MDIQTIREIQSEIRALQAKLDEILARDVIVASRGMGSLKDAIDKVMPEYDLDIALTMYADHLKADYNKWNQDVSDAKFDVTFERGRKFIKVVKTSWGSRSVHSFICIQPHGKFQFGDILKAASWAQPAKNFARGNVLDPSSYSNHKWTGA
jgi:hypothetical protein